MKKIFTLKLLALLGGVLLFTQCGGIRHVSMNAMRPADITFPSDVNTLLLLDRTKFDKSAVNIIEGVLTGELPGADKAALQASMSSFQSAILNSPRFKVTTATESLEGNSITSAFPNALDWSKVEALCKQYNADAIVSFEIFDTDFIVTDGKRKAKKKVKDDKGVEKEIEVDEYFAKGVANVTIGIRLYDPKAKSIVDQQLFSKSNVWEATGNSIADAAAHLIVKNEATRYVSGLVGTDYAYKIAPMPIRITRDFYAKSKRTPELTQGGRQADVNEWNNAIKTWESGIRGAREKDAGRLCYNIAVAYEVIGDLEKAKQWAGRAYVDYGNKKARTYSSALSYRMQDEERLRQQME